MSEWFKKEAGFRYRVDGRTLLHFMNGGEECHFKSIDPALSEDYETLDKAINEAKAYVNCDDAYGRCPECGGKPFEATATRRGVGSLEERVAEVTRLGLCADPNDPEDEGEWKPCDQNGTFWNESDWGDCTVVRLAAAPIQVREAWSRVKRSYRDYFDNKRESYTDVVAELGLQDQGWYSFEPFDKDGMPMLYEDAPAIWIDDKKDFMKSFTEASKLAQGGEVDVEWHGAEIFPNESRAVVQWEGPFGKDLRHLFWQKTRKTVGEMTCGEAEDFLHDLGIVIESGELRDELDMLDVIDGSDDPEDMAARAHEAAKKLAPQRVRG